MNDAINRNENMDLLRLVSMFFVVCTHYVGWGGIAGTDNVLIMNYAVAGQTVRKPRQSDMKFW